MAEWLEPAAITDMLRTSLRLTIPIAFAAMGGVLSERSGVYNIGLEGMILGGAFGAALGTFVTGSPVGGVIFGMLLGMLAALVLGILAIYFAVNQIVCGIAINLVVIGLTAFLARLIFGLDATTQTLPGFSTIPIPFLSALPIIGPVFFNQDPLIYILYITAPMLYWLLYRSDFGLGVRATGENPAAADAAGVAVFHIRLACVLMSGALAG